MNTANRKNLVVSIRDVEPGLVAATIKLGKKLSMDLEGIVLVSPDFVDHDERVVDNTGLFKEVICDFDDLDSIQNALKPFVDRILVVTCRLEDAIQQFAKAIPFMPYTNTPSETSLKWSTEKSLMRDRLRGYDEKLVPKYCLLKDLNTSNIDQHIKGMEFPLIVKPNGLNSSLLVTICKDYQELISCLKHTFDVIGNLYIRERGSGDPSILIEEVMNGEMYSIDAYVSPQGNIYCLPLVQVITGNAAGHRGFYSYRHIVPARVSQKEAENAEFAARSAVRALNLRSCSAHIELFFTNNGWKIIELGPRLGGYREDLYRESYGIDHYYNDLLVRMGLEPEIPLKLLKCSAGMNIFAEEEGVIESIDGLDEAKELSSVVYLKRRVQDGQVALFNDNGGLYIVKGILSNVDADKLEKDVTRVRQLVKIKIKKQ